MHVVLERVKQAKEALVRGQGFLCYRLLLLLLLLLLRLQLSPERALLLLIPGSPFPHVLLLLLMAAGLLLGPS